jgi:hypothetical protein
MGRACNQRTLGRRPGCEYDMESNVEIMQNVIGDFAGTPFFVDPNHPRASNQHAGTDPDFPLRTVAAAQAKCTPYTGDVIAVMHNSYWTYADVSRGRATPILEAVTVTVPGIRIVGVSPSSLGVPWVPPANNAICLTIHAMDVLVEGFCFWNNLHTGCSGIEAEWVGAGGIYGENFTARRCYFYGLAYGIQFDYSWNCHVEGCRFNNLTTAAIHNPSVHGEPDYLTIRNNVFANNTADLNLPDCDYALIEDNTFMDVTAAIVITGGDYNQILTNAIQGNGAGTNNFINLTGGASNLVGANLLGCTIAQYDTTCSDATSGAWVGNQCTNGPTTAPPV